MRKGKCKNDAMILADSMSFTLRRHHPFSSSRSRRTSGPLAASFIKWYTERLPLPIATEYLRKCWPLPMSIMKYPSLTVWMNRPSARWSYACSVIRNWGPLSLARMVSWMIIAFYTVGKKSDSARDLSININIHKLLKLSKTWLSDISSTYAAADYPMHLFLNSLLGLLASERKERHDSNYNEYTK